MKNHKHLIIVFSVALVFSFDYSHAQSCVELFKQVQTNQDFTDDRLSETRRLTLSEYAERANNEAKKAKLPQFTTPQDEIAAAATWAGVRGPEIIQQMLPDGALFVSHQLRGSNGDGLVKTASGNMVHLRAEVNGIGTNFGVSLGALKDNLHRENKSFVRDEADAVVIFIHGGGTKTTGHHVAASMMSYMGTRNIDVVSLDMPWHGEGPRVSISSAKESLEIIREFIKKFVSPSGKPVILVGHSMGGMIADMYMRAYPNDTLVKAVVPMSTVADPAPGGSIAKKLEIESQIAANNLTNPNIPEGERDLGEWLARQNKLSPTCGMFCQVLMYSIDWKVPDHGGSNFLPALYIIGEADGLYQGYQQSFAEGVASLPRAELKVITKRRDIKDKSGETRIPIGHLIFDHKPDLVFAPELDPDIKMALLNGSFMKAEWHALSEKKLINVDLLTYQKLKFEELKKAGLVQSEKGVEIEDLGTPETFVIVRNFIAKVIGKPTQKIQQEVSPLEVVTQAWANNLVFRQFAKTYVFEYKRPTAAGAAMGQEFTNLSVKIAAAKKAVTANPGNSQLKAEKDKLEKRYAELNPIVKAKGKVDPVHQSDYDAIKKEYDDFNSTTLNALNNLRKSLRQELVDLKATLSNGEKFILGHSKKLSSPKIRDLNAATEKSFAMMMNQDLQVRVLTDAYLSSGAGSDGRPPSMDRLPPSIVREFQKFDQMSHLYQKLLAKLNQQILVEAQAGTIGVINSEYSIVVDQVVQKAQVLKRASERMKAVYSELEKSDLDFAQASTRVFQLEIKMAKLTGTEYFTPEYYTIEQLLSGSETLNLLPEQVSSLLQKIWADWLRLWSTRIADTSDSLY